MRNKTAVSQEVRNPAADLRNKSQEMKRTASLLTAKAEVMEIEALDLDCMADKWENAKGDEIMPEETTEKPSGSDKVDDLVRSSLARGRRYQYAGYGVGIEITHVAFRGHVEDDGGLQGVGIKWWGYPKKREGAFYPCASDEEFFAMLLFRNAFDLPNTSVQPPCG